MRLQYDLCRTSYQQTQDNFELHFKYCRTPVLGLGLGVDCTFAWDKINRNKKNKNPHLIFLKGTVQGVKEQTVKG